MISCDAFGATALAQLEINRHLNLAMALTSNALGEGGGLNQKERRMCRLYLEIKTPRTSISSSRNGTCSPLPIS